MSQDTYDILANTEVIAVNQGDPYPEILPRTIQAFSSAMCDAFPGKGKQN